MTERAIDQAINALRQVGEELRAAFVEERRAIARLDHARLDWLAQHKRAITDRLAELCRAAPAALEGEIRTLLEAVRVEARATAMLASLANEAVRALLGVEQTGYDRHARRTSTTGLRLLAAY